MKEAKLKREYNRCTQRAIIAYRKYYRKRWAYNIFGVFCLAISVLVITASIFSAKYTVFVCEKIKTPIEALSYSYMAASIFGFVTSILPRKIRSTRADQQIIASNEFDDMMSSLEKIVAYGKLCLGIDKEVKKIKKKDVVKYKKHWLYGLSISNDPIYCKELTKGPLRRDFSVYSWQWVNPVSDSLQEAKSISRCYERLSTLPQFSEISFTLKDILFEIKANKYLNSFQEKEFPSNIFLTISNGHEEFYALVEILAKVERKWPFFTFEKMEKLSDLEIDKYQKVLSKYNNIYKDKEKDCNYFVQECGVEFLVKKGEES